VGVRALRLGLNRDGSVWPEPPCPISIDKCFILKAPKHVVRFVIDKYDSRKIRAEIRNVFMDVWDPIGVRNLTPLRSEYDRYIGTIYGMLIRGCSDEELLDHLLSIERERMELPSPGSNIRRTIAVLRAIKLPPH
jgi:hypothetical protein